MSGVEVLAVVGIIANILQLADFDVDIYKGAKAFSHHVDKLPKLFKAVSAMLPLIKNSRKFLKSVSKMNHWTRGLARN